MMVDPERTWIFLGGSLLLAALRLSAALVWMGCLPPLPGSKEPSEVLLFLHDIINQ